jgi:hypothetical protein
LSTSSSYDQFLGSLDATLLANFEHDVCINGQGKTFQMLKCSCWSSTTLIISSSSILLGEQMRVLRTASILVLSMFLLAGPQPP